MSYDPNNIFAKILRKEISAQIIYEDDNVLAFNDIFPKAPTHVLVIPKASYVSFDDFINTAAAEKIVVFFQTIRKIAHQLGLAESGYRLMMNHGQDSGQEVPHFHVHILGGKPLPRPDKA